MVWLRIDDGFLSHPKVVELTDRELKQWLSVLLYCARYRTEGKLSDAAARSLSLTPRHVDRFVALRLLDRMDSGVQVHDWELYNPKDPTAADRMKRHRERNADRNEKRNDDRNEPRNEQRNDDRNANRDSRVGTRPRPVPSLREGDDSTPLSVEESSPTSPSLPPNPPPSEQSGSLALAGSRSPDSDNGTDYLEPDPEGQKRILEIMRTAFDQPDDDNPHKDPTSPTVDLTDDQLAQAEQRKAASKLWLAQIRDEEDGA